MKPIYYGALLVLAMFLNSCSKGDSANPANSNGTCTLSAAYVPGKWQIEKLELKSNGSFTDITSQFELCDRDDYFLFRSDGTYSRVEAGTVCSTNRAESGTWSFTNGKFSSNGIEEVVTIINCNKCIREFTNQYSQTFRYTMNKIP